MNGKIKSKLKDVPETMLWTLHNRATEAMRPDGVIKDEKCIEIYKSINYDYERSFGKAEPSHAVRSITFDNHIIEFLKKYPNGTIINLGEGLETQRFRIKENKAFWLSVDLPDAIEIREIFIKPNNRYFHSPVSVLDKKWFDVVPKDKPVFITAQGLFMYFKEDEVKSIIKGMLSTFFGGYLMFDTIPKWISNKTMSEKGWRKTKYYTAPKMPWGINRNEYNKFKEWHLDIKEIKEVTYYFPRGYQKWIFNTISSIPILRNYTPTCFKIKF